MGLFKRRNKDLFTIAQPGQAAMDTGPEPDPGFRMTVTDVFVIRNRGAVVTGTVEAGSVVVGSRITVERSGHPPVTARVTAIEMFRKRVKRASPGDQIGLLLPQLTRTDVTAGDVIRT